METRKCIKTRRSRRKFLDKEIPDRIVKKLIDAAAHAPFGGPPIKSCQLWEFVIVRNEATKKKLALDYEDRQYIVKAPVLIAVCTDKNKDMEYRDWDITVSLAIENLLLTAHDLGLGACFVTTFTHHISEKHQEDRRKLIEVLSLPDDIELIAIIPIGYPDPSEEIEKKDLRETNEMMHFDKW